MDSLRKPGSGLLLPTILATVGLGLGLLLSPEPVFAFPGEPEGFESLRWGTTAQELLKQRTSLGKRGYRLPTLLAGLEKHKGGILLQDSVDHLGFPGAALTLYVSKQGLFKAEVNLHDPDPMNYTRREELFKQLTAAYGSPQLADGKRSVWKGDKTVIEAVEQPEISGMRIMLTYTRRAEFDDQQQP